MKIKPKRSPHFYTPSGEPRYGAGLREARKEGLYPSTTTITGIVDKYVIRAWEQSLLLDAAWEWHNETVLDLPEDEWKELVIKEWEWNKSSAAELGTAYHAAIEEMLRDVYDAQD